ncbi:nuclear pore complex protein Nup98-Nup96 [Toxorhynchites rutilus septentrionalis]|uniref:nuclear pore complex protein Nup98-Nup96 n=1 Tax=Toxorhynchites rutilus septentrionalis TaxID=329112 RepID=UPI0024793E93|nr:nuclear pore complex protein Nup98-Nup96 [Toxorhynchites rutilus septentrionalis]
MFGAKPGGFGQTSAAGGFGTFGNNTATASPFGQTGTFGKPATTGAFGTTPAFGQQATPSLFGQTQPTGGLFGANTSTAPAFGATATTQSGFGAFGQPQQQTTSLFGTQNNTAPNTSLFGTNNNNSTFGAAKPAGFGGFGQAPTQTSLFGQASTSQTTTGGFFGQNAQSGGLFGGPKTAFGAAAPVGGANGTAVAKYQQTPSTDTLVKNGQTNTVQTKQHCITFMKEYENKSVEELRFDDYGANRKGPQTGATAGGFFGATPAATPFGAPVSQPQSLFGQNTTSQPSTGLFGSTTNTFGQSTAPAFGSTQNAGFGKPFGATNANTSFGFGQTNTNALGGLGAAKTAFGAASTSLFGQTAAPATNTFGQTSTFGGFGTQNQTPATGGLFSGTATSTAPGTSGFGGLVAQTSQTGFGFGSNTATNTTGGGLFGAKPANTFGTLGSSFGQNPTSTAPTFGGFGTNTSTGGTLFGSSFNKPAAPSFGLNTATSTGTFGGGLNFGTGSGSLFGNTANKPGGLGTGTGLFGNTSTLGGGGAFGTLGTGGFGSGLGTSVGLGTTGQPTQTTVPIHQQILAMVTSPYGDNPIFKDIKPLSGTSEDSLKPTNPSAQKAILESGNQQFKVSPKVTVGGVKVKPVSAATLSKKSLFEGLEEYDSTLDESFSLKPNAKRLIIKPKSATPTITIQNRSTLVSQVQANESTAAAAKEDQNPKETFQNQIPVNQFEPQPSSSASSNQETNRRVSWLQSNALDKVRQSNRLSESILESTIKEFAPVGSAQSTATSLLKEGLLDSSSPTGSTTGAAIGGGQQQPQPAGGAAKKDSISSGSSPINMNDSLLSNRSFLNETANATSGVDVSGVSAGGAEQAEPHPTGIVLNRVGYYTIPSLDEILQLMDEEGRCVVSNFTIGRKGYGNVYFNEPIDVANLNLDEIVHFRHKEVIIYPDDENKPPVGVGLNRKAQITLDQVWPHDKALHEPIKDPNRLALMDYEGKLRKVCDKHDTRFLEYRPDTGSWVFKVDHFSKYGLSDSDEDEVPVDPKKVKMMTFGEDDKLGKKTGAISKNLQGTTAQIDREKMLVQDEQSYSLIADGSLAPTSPTAALAIGMGTDSHKLQLMKASFFVDDDFDRRSVFSEMTDGGRDSPDQTVPNKPYGGLGRTLTSTLYLRNDATKIIESRSETLDDSFAAPPKLFSTSTSKNLYEQIQQQKRLDTTTDIPRPMGPRSLPLVIKPKVELVHSRDIVLPMAQSILARFLDNKSDLAFFHGRKFRVGWSFPSVLVQLNTAENCSQLKKDAVLHISDMHRFFNGRSDKDYSPTALQMMQIRSSAEIVDFRKSVEDHLKIQLKHDEVQKVENSECPYFVAAGGHTALADHLEMAKLIANGGSFEALCVEIWSLCDALWGDREELEDVEESAHLSTMFRRDLFSEWLERVVTERSAQDGTAALKGKKQEYLDRLLELICTHKVLNACELAFENDDINLSMLLAQISGGPTIRQLIQHQLSSWQDVEADKFIDARRLKVFMLIAGIPLLSSSHGTLNVFEKLDWLKSLALHLWYLCSSTASITDALVNYEKSFQSDEFFALPPTPAYTSRIRMSSPKPIQDIRFHLLKLYSKRSHPLEALLNPATHTPDPLDFRLSWFLLQILETLGYRHCSELSRSQLHVSFANQLENHDMWHWAIYVLLHLNDASRREITIQAVLYRHIQLSGDDDYLEREQFVVGELGIPEQWIFWAKAVRAGAQFDHHQQAKFLLKAKQWSQAHEVIMEHIAADCVINDNIPYLKSLLTEFEDVKQISNWFIKGQILSDFIELNEKFDLIRDAIDDEVAEARLEELKPKLSDLCSVIKMFPCPTPKHRLCQSEIAQRLAYLIRSFFAQDPRINSCALMRNALEKLPLPQEYALEELRHMLSAFLDEDLRKQQ